MIAVGQIHPWRSSGVDGGLPLDSFRAGRMPATEAVGPNRSRPIERSAGHWISVDRRSPCPTVGSQPERTNTLAAVAPAHLRNPASFG